MVVQLQARLHAVKVLELDEAEAPAFLRIAALSGYPDRGRGVFCKVGGY